MRSAVVSNSITRLSAILLVSCLTACGFQLRGQAKLPSAMATTYLVGQGELVRELRLLLRGNNVQVSSQRREASAILSITDERMVREVQSVGERARVNEYALNYTLNFSLSDANNRVLLEPQTIELTRDYTLDETQILGVASEEELIRNELRREMAREIVRRLEYAAQQ